MTRLLFTLLVLVLVPSGCTYTYIPLVREVRAPAPRLSITEPSGLGQNETSVKLTLVVATVPEADWLAVQWFSPANDEVAAESVWLEPLGTVQTVAVSLPPDIALKDGLWRAVVSYQGQLARQFSVTVRVP